MAIIPIWLLVSAAITCSFAVFLKKIDINKVAMRFFRDVARTKARKRLYGNEHALMLPMLLGKEEPYEELQAKFAKEEQDDVELLYLTLEELSYYDGEIDEEAPIYLSINKRIYDVSTNRKYYGINGKYHLFVGKDATRAYATGCLDATDTINCVTSNTDGLSDKEFKEISRWMELYDTHDKYKLVGYLIDVDPVDAILQQDEKDEYENENAEEEVEVNEDGGAEEEEKVEVEN